MAMDSGERFVIDTADFVDRDEAAAFFRDMLRRHRPGMRVGPADARHPRALIERHPDRDAKVGAGVAGFTVLRTEHHTPCFGIVRTDGSVVDFSIRHCIQGRATSKFQTLKKALRLAVRRDIDRLKTDGYRDAVESEGETFGGIVKAYLESRGIDPKLLVLEVRPGRITPELTDDAVVADFRAYHLERMAAAA